MSTERRCGVGRQGKGSSMPTTQSFQAMRIKASVFLRKARCKVTFASRYRKSNRLDVVEQAQVRKHRELLASDLDVRGVELGSLSITFLFSLSLSQQVLEKGRCCSRSVVTTFRTFIPGSSRQGELQQSQEQLRVLLQLRLNYSSLRAAWSSRPESRQVRHTVKRGNSAVPHRHYYCYYYNY